MDKIKFLESFAVSQDHPAKATKSGCVAGTTILAFTESVGEKQKKISRMHRYLHHWLRPLSIVSSLIQKNGTNNTLKLFRS